jgi:anthranilate/para-aminobenzoate synthase component I
VREVLSDLDTPLSVYLKLADGPHTYLFESVEGGERFGRHSIIGLPARRVYEFRGHTLEVREHGEVVETREVADPLAEVELLRAAHQGTETRWLARLCRRVGRLVRLRVHRVHRAAPARQRESRTNSARPTSC